MRRHRSLRSRLVGIPARQLLLLLDYDGTLAPIVLRPDRATLSAPVRAVLRRLVRLMPVAIVSGLALCDLRRRVKVPVTGQIACLGLVFKLTRAPLRLLRRRVPLRVVLRLASA